MAEKKQGEAQPQVETPVVPRVYLKDPSINRSSMWHRAYVGGLDGGRMHVLEITGGTKKGLSLEDFELFRDAGVITTERPKRQHDDIED